MKNLGAIAASVLVAGLVSLAIGDGGQRIGSLPISVLCAIVAFGINWVAFVPSWFAQTERYYDLVGSITYITVTVMALLLSNDLDARAVLAGLLVVVWAGRLGTFLFRRIVRDGSDSRFDTIKADFTRFLLTWTMQGLWVTLTSAAAWAIITTDHREPFGVWAIVGLMVWVAGFGIEATADQQKSAFKADPANEGQFIDVGLWAWSRHPNYFGEIVLWVGMAIIALPILGGWSWVALISPVFVTLLLTRVSGIPLLERKAEKRWGDDPDYRAYVERTPVLIPRPPG